MRRSAEEKEKRPVGRWDDWLELVVPEPWEDQEEADALVGAAGAQSAAAVICRAKFPHSGTGS